jgi:hypothetical protein
MIGVDVRGIDDVQDALGKLDAKQSKAMLQKSASAGAKVLKGTVKTAAPKGATGNLRRSIRSGQTKRHRPAARVYVVKKVAFYRHMVVGGTKAHGPRTATWLVFRPAGAAHNVWAKRVRGTQPRPFFAQGFDAGRSAAEREIDKVVDKYLSAL